MRSYRSVVDSTARCNTDNLYYMANDEARSISAIIANKCATCHFQGNYNSEQVLETYDQIDLTQDKVGIFSKFATLDTILREKDRVEIYRPLIADPKKVRRERAAKGKTMRSVKKA